MSAAVVLVDPTGPTIKLENLSAVRNGTTETGGV
jgi:hypothetical protein